MSFTISPALKPDARSLVLIDEADYLTNPIRRKISAYSTSPSSLQETHIQWASTQLRLRLEADATSIFLKIVDPNTSEIVGWADLKKPHLQLAAKMPNAREAKNPDAEPTPLDPSPVLNLEAVMEFVGMWEDVRKRAVGERDDYWCIAKLDIAPEYQRRGAGSQLAEHMLSIVDGSGLDVYLGAPPGPGVKFFAKYGFDVVEEVGFPCEEGPQPFTAMLRKGKGVRGEARRKSDASRG